MRRIRGEACLRFLRATAVPLLFLFVAVLFQVEDGVEGWVDD
jgi:hypothetical protein